MKTEYIEKIYAGWLAKIIGIRLGAAVEGWTYEDIKNVFGELKDYPTPYSNFAADDDSNGPIFFVRALEDSLSLDFTAQEAALALLNYAPCEHGFFWWGGYGVSTEHTAYANLRQGIPTPQSGSIAQNGATVAEQIGGQIFVDCWGLVTPGDPDKAARYAQRASSVTHDGNGVYGGMFVSACISQAFVEQDIMAIIEKGLSYIPSDCEYTRVVRSVIGYYLDHPQSTWRECYHYIHSNFGYDRYPGTCHIIPNAAVMILALLYGGGDFSETLNICNMCGWDTDCNVGNVATIMGVRCGLEGIDYDKWRKPINDLLINSSVIGSLNIQDIPYGAVYMAKLAYAVAGESPEAFWQDIMKARIHSCHFELPGSTHAIRVKKDEKTGTNQQLEQFIVNTNEAAATGTRALKVTVKPLDSAERFYIYQKTYYLPEDFSDSRYDPSFSPTIYPGQTLHGSIMLPTYSKVTLKAELYVKDLNSGDIYAGEAKVLTAGQWERLSFTIPALEGALLEEMGFRVTVVGASGSVGERGLSVTCLIDDLYATGAPSYGLDFANAKQEVWNVFHREISQMTRLKGLMYLEDESLHLSCSDFGEAYTGAYNWTDYSAEFQVTPLTGYHHQVNFRVQGAIRSYAIALLADNQLALLKNSNGYKVLATQPFTWEHGQTYTIQVEVKDNQIRWQVGDQVCTYEDLNQPYSYGQVGISVRQGSHLACSQIKIHPVEESR